MVKDLSRYRSNTSLHALCFSGEDVERIWRFYALAVVIERGVLKVLIRDTREFHRRDVPLVRSASVLRGAEYILGSESLWLVYAPRAFVYTFTWIGLKLKKEE